MVSLVPSSGKPEIIVTEPTNNQPSQNNPVRSKSEFEKKFLRVVTIRLDPLPDHIFA